MRRSLIGVLLGLLLFTTLAACNLGAAGITPSPTPEIPTATILAPANNARVVEGVELDIEILGEDLGQGISRIELIVDGISINTATPQTDAASVPQFRVVMNWLAEGIGLHRIEAVAYRLDGTPSREAIIVVEVVTE